MNRLTRQEQFVVGILIFLFLFGLAVKAYRSAHPPLNLSSKSTP